MSVILITGASSGIGFDTARELALKGHTVYGAARRMERLQELSAFGVKPLVMDVTDDASMQRGIQELLIAEGRLDVLINNAGYGLYGALEDVDIEEARRQFEVNLFGLARITQLVLPTMRAQKSGRIINISSMGGRVSIALGGWYHSSKYAVEGLSDALRAELREFGIKVSIIEPGGTRTEWGSIAADHLEESSRHGAYAQAAAKKAGRIRKFFNSKLASPPELITKAIVDAVESKNPKTRYLVGYGTKPVIFLSVVLPDRAFDAFKRLID